MTVILPGFLLGFPSDPPVPTEALGEWLREGGATPPNVEKGVRELRPPMDIAPLVLVALVAENGEEEREDLGCVRGDGDRGRLGLAVASISADMRLNSLAIT